MKRPESFTDEMSKWIKQYRERGKLKCETLSALRRKYSLSKQEASDVFDYWFVVLSGEPEEINRRTSEYYEKQNIVPEIRYPSWCHILD